MAANVLSGYCASATCQMTLFDAEDAEQAAIDAGEWNDDVGVWQREPAGQEPK